MFGGRRSKPGEQRSSFHFNLLIIIDGFLVVLIKFFIFERVIYNIVVRTGQLTNSAWWKLYL